MSQVGFLIALLLISKFVANIDSVRLACRGVADATVAHERARETEQDSERIPAKPANALHIVDRHASALDGQHERRVHRGRQRARLFGRRAASQHAVDHVGQPLSTTRRTNRFGYKAAKIFTNVVVLLFCFALF